MIAYQVSLHDPKTHLFEISLRIDAPQEPIQKLRLPNWIPGSYLIRDFAKNIVSISAFDDNGQEVAVETLDKSTWQLTSERAVTIRYQVYAWDLSVRSAHFDESHAFFNGTSLFLEVVEQATSPHQVEILTSSFTQVQNWKVATGMPATDVDASGFGFYQAPNYQELIDYPFEIGSFKEINFEAHGIPHRMVLTGLFDLDEERLKTDLIKICETELALFGKPYPIESYLFQVMVTGNDYGGLEHSNSTALICGRNDLPFPGMGKATDGYLQFLELCSHEYFHTWNVKRIQPEPYQKSDLQTPVYTTQLWWFEGVTSYYDALILFRAGIVDEKTYLKLLAQQMTRVYRMPGRLQQSVAESSWLTWTKFYQQDENAPNAIISYYTKGSLIALALDLTIRKQTQNSKSLDDILLYLWQQNGLTRKGLRDGEIEQICSAATGVELDDFFKEFLFAAKDLPLHDLLAEFGVLFNLKAASNLNDLGGFSDSEKPSNQLKSFLGANIIETASGLQISHIWNNQAAAKSGLAAKDEIIAIDNIRIKQKNQLELILQRKPAGTEVSCHYFRRDELRQTLITLESPLEDRVYLQISDQQKLTKWLQPA